MYFGPDFCILIQKFLDISKDRKGGQTSTLVVAGHAQVGDNQENLNKLAGLSAHCTDRQIGIYGE